MKKKWTVSRRKSIFGIKFLCLLLFSLVLSGCSYHDRQFSYFNMLDTEKRTLQNKKAAKKFWSSVRPISTLSTSFYKLGRYYQQQGKYDKAIEEFSKALRNDSKYCIAYNGIAMSYDALRSCEMAYDSYESAIQCAPQEAYLYNNYACSSLLCGDYEKSIALLLEALQLSEDNTRINNNLKLAQMMVERKNNSDTFIPLKSTVALRTQTRLESDENVGEASLTEPIYKIPGNVSPEGIQPTAVIDKSVVESVRHNKSEAPIQMSGFAHVQPMIRETVQKMGQSSSTAPNVDGNENTVNELESSLHKNIASISSAVEKAQKVTAHDNAPTLPAYLKDAVEVSNGNGVTGMAGRSADYFRAWGFNIRRITNAKHFQFNDSMIFYREGYLQVAKEIASVIPGLQNMKKVDSLERASIGVRILLGKDLVNMQFPEGYAINSNAPTSEKNHLITSAIAMANQLVIY